MIVMTKYNSTKTRSSILGTGQISTVTVLGNHQVKIIKQENDLDVLINWDEYNLSKSYSCQKDRCNLAISRDKFSVEIGMFYKKLVRSHLELCE